MKIAIVTLFYRSMNYGGVLQAYALCKSVQKMNSDIKVEQISYDFSGHTKEQRYLLYAKQSMFGLVKYLIPSRRRGMLADKRKKKAFDAFRKKIPHTKRVYDRNSISECLRTYDVWITGSDQVWNPLIYDEVLRLDFVPGDKKKVSYAASISQFELSMAQQAIFRRTLKDYSAISVREDLSVQLLGNLTDKPVHYVVDPTLLLDATDWNEIASPRLVDESYIFCYFLGNSEVNVRLTKELAEANRMCTVAIAYTGGAKTFADVNLQGVSPEDFVSLVKHASFVLTDSFHATVFSLLYGKQFFVVDREEYKGMASRLEALLHLFGIDERFGNTPERRTVTYVAKLPPINQSVCLNKFEAMKERSWQFLQGIVDPVRKAV